MEDLRIHRVDAFERSREERDDGDTSHPGKVCHFSYLEGRDSVRGILEQVDGHPITLQLPQLHEARPVRNRMLEEANPPSVKVAPVRAANVSAELEPSAVVARLVCGQWLVRLETRQPVRDVRGRPLQVEAAARGGGEDEVAPSVFCTDSSGGGLAELHRHAR